MFPECGSRTALACCGRSTGSRPACPRPASPVLLPSALRTVGRSSAMESLRHGRKLGEPSPNRNKGYPFPALTVRASSTSFFCSAEVVELVDALASGASGGNLVWVRVPPSALLLLWLHKRHGELRFAVPFFLSGGQR